MKKLIGFALTLIITLILMSSIQNISKSETIDNQDYAARVPLPIPPPPENLK